MDYFVKNQLFPHSWQRQTFFKIVLDFDSAFAFFQTRFDTPNVLRATNPLAALFTCPPRPTLVFLVLLPVSAKDMDTF